MLDSVDLNEIFYYLDRNLKWFVFYQAVLSTHKITLQIIIVCPSNWIFRIFLFKHDPQLLLTVPLKKKNSFEFLKIYKVIILEDFIKDIYEVIIVILFQGNIILIFSGEKCRDMEIISVREISKYTILINSFDNFVFKI